MKAFVITSISIAILSGLLRLGALVWLEYPRQTKTMRGGDAFGVLVTIAWCAWGIYLLTR